eukprot:364257-Chlamydomonas_euryale.AAC.4
MHAGFILHLLKVRPLLCCTAVLCRVYVVPALLYAVLETSSLTDHQLQPLVSAHSACLRRITSMGRQPDGTLHPAAQVCAAAEVPQLMHVLNAARLARPGHVARMPDESVVSASAALRPVLTSWLAGCVPCPLLDPYCHAALNTGIPFMGPLPATLILTHDVLCGDGMGKESSTAWSGLQGADPTWIRPRNCNLIMYRSIPVRFCVPGMHVHSRKRHMSAERNGREHTTGRCRNEAVMTMQGLETNFIGSYTA